MMTALVACLGLLPAAMSTGVGDKNGRFSDPSGPQKALVKRTPSPSRKTNELNRFFCMQLFESVRIQLIWT